MRASSWAIIAVALSFFGTTYGAPTVMPAMDPSAPRTPGVTVGGDGPYAPSNATARRDLSKRQTGRIEVQWRFAIIGTPSVFGETFKPRDTLYVDWLVHPMMLVICLMIHSGSVKSLVANKMC